MGFFETIKPRLGWVIVVFLSLVPVAIFAFTEPLAANFSTSFDVLSSIGRLTAWVGTVLYAINLILSTRLRFTEDYFGGLNKTYSAHHIIGGIALILLLFHPMLLALRLIESMTISSIQAASQFLLPRSLAGFSWPLTGMAKANYAANNGMIAFFGMVVLLFITFFVKMPYQLWLLTHRFLGVAFFFAGIHIFLAGNTYNPALKIYMLTLVALGLVAFCYRTLLGSILVRTYRYKVDEVNLEGDSVVELIMSPVGKPMPYQCGQFIFVRFRQAKGRIASESHPFSISSDPGHNRLHIDAKALGDYTATLQRLKPGAIAQIEGAYGRFSYRNWKSKKQIWIAGGIGITPFLSMAQTLKPNGPAIDLYYSVKAQSEFVHYANLQQMMPHLKNFRCIPWVVDKDGLLSAEAIAKKSGDLSAADILICGPPPMMAALKQQFRDLGLSKKRVHTEEFRFQ